MDEEKLFEDLQDVIYSKEIQNKEYALIYRKNIEFFEEILSGCISFKKGVEVSTLFIYMNIFDLKEEDIEMFKEYRDYLLISGFEPEGDENE